MPERKFKPTRTAVDGTGIVAAGNAAAVVAGERSGDGGNGVDRMSPGIRLREDHLI